MSNSLLLNKMIKRPLFLAVVATFAVAACSTTQPIAQAPAQSYVVSTDPVRIDNRRYAPAVYDSRRRGDERLYDANVTSVRAVVGAPERRCWVESEQVAQDRSGANVPGAIVGAVIGGVLGHQVGGGSGQDIATVGGAVVGGVVGANVGRTGGGQQVQTQGVQRCESVASQTRAEFWDVTYEFRGQEHRIQMTAPPGRTVTVNEYGEPRT